MKYLARYLTGGPISNTRIIAADEAQVTFWAREGKTPGGDTHSIEVTLPIEEYTRRWSLHILPKGYTKTRRFGGWSNTRRDSYLERCAILLEATKIWLSASALDFSPLDLIAEMADGIEVQQDYECPCCGSPMKLVGRREKPSWSDIMNSPQRPSWYARDHLPATLHRSMPSE